MKKIRTIQEFLGIDIDSLNENSVFKIDSISELNDDRNFLLFDLKSKFIEIFDQYQISFFDGKAQHLEFRTSKCDSDNLRKLIDLIVDEYGTDENKQSSSGWNTSKHLSWWFRNEEHESTYDEYENRDDLYYGIMISENKTNGIEFSIINYSNVDPRLEKINWLQQRV